MTTPPAASETRYYICAPSHAAFLDYYEVGPDGVCMYHHSHGSFVASESTVLGADDYPEITAAKKDAIRAAWKEGA